MCLFYFFFSIRRRHTRYWRDWSSDVCSSDLVPEARTPAAFKDWVDAQFDPSVTWDDLAWVREHWPGRLVVKGVLDPDDARRAVDAGVDGLVVSNHGGRQLDSVPSTARALPAVADAVGDEVEVLADGGVRTGLDVVKMVRSEERGGGKGCRSRRTRDH